ncbi:ParB/RepB/Spo0J family partition protein [Sphingopyxis sp. GW247-27LB]|uniref:ParB/RepB/Spo0J family partition protein n=1 Tax=Sphingopyxis sp. GW247-27LB TaxID=2012632 RepID=UPI000BA66131|nr:ParB/RepB/Spo0J family partition protein [Sphingopyxis sp. GW247-27LB]PAL25514.1 hypothetical protein CD928_03305 [Sphingopyxis sp. GW247-27LB]
MAAAPIDAAVEVFPINPDDVYIPAGIGMFWPEEAAAIGASMKRDGQNDPIKVVFRNDRWELVAGRHRTHGARAMRLPWIYAIEVKGTAAELRLIEASENIHRRNFGPIERALFVRAIADDAEARWSEGHDGMTPQQIGQIKRWEKERAKVDGVVRPDDAANMEAEYSSAKLAGLYGWQDEVAETLGLSSRSLQRSLLIHRQLIAPFEPEVWEELARSPHGRNASSLEALCRIKDADARRDTIDLLIDNPALKVEQALAIVDEQAPQPKVRVTGDTKYMDNAGSNLARLSASGWRSFAPALAESIKPSALLAVRDAIEARIAELGADAVGGEHA